MTRRVSAALVGLALVAGMSVLVPAPPASAELWLPETEATVGPADEIRETATANAPDGSFVIAWAESTDGGDTSWTVQVATRAPGSTGLSAPVEAAPPGTTVSSLVLVVDGTGATTVAWARRATFTESRMEAVRRKAGAVDLADPETVGIGDPGTLRGVGDQQGRVTLAWSSSQAAPDGGSYSVETATWEPDLAGWSDAEAFATVGPSAPDLAVDGAGAVTVVWVDFSEEQNLVHTRRRPAGSASFEPTQTLTPSGAHAYMVDVASNAAGNTVAMWVLMRDDDWLIRLAVRPAGEASFGVPLDVASTSSNSRDPVVAIDAAGTAIVAWAEPETDSSHIWVATAPSGGGFAPPVEVASGYITHDLLLSGSAAGAAVLAWTQGWDDTSGSRVARAAYRPAGGVFGAPIDLTERVAGIYDGRVAASVDGAGHAFAGWTRTTQDDNSRERAYARVLDSGAPALHRVSVPAAGAAGVSVAVSASATDVWSGPPLVSWDFGDGGSGVGGSSSHVYAAAGTYVVRVTATDGVGNATSRTRTIVVRDATAPVLSQARLTPGRLPTGHGARLRVSSSERAALSGVVQRRSDGRWRGVGAKRWSVQVGSNTRTFYGKTSERRLRSGAYRVLLVATDPAGNTSVTTSIRFWVDRG